MPQSKDRKPIVSLLVAMSENRVIGRENALPWRLPADLKRFKTLTTGRTIIMGRKTWDSLPRWPLPGRRNVVITRNRAFEAAGAAVVHSLEAALREGAGEDEIFVIGGERIFQEALPLADRLYLTVVHASVEGDTYFPEFNGTGWRLVEDDRRPADEMNPYDYSFRIMERRDGQGENGASPRR